MADNPYPQAYLKYSRRVGNAKSYGRETYVDVYEVTDCPKTIDGAYYALRANGLPTFPEIEWASHLTTAEYSARPTENESIYEVDVRWHEDPLAIWPEVNFFSMSKPRANYLAYNRALFKMSGSRVPDADFDGDYYGDRAWSTRNTAGLPFNPPPAYDWPLDRIEVTTRWSCNRMYDTLWHNYLKHTNEHVFYIEQFNPDVPDDYFVKVYDPGSLILWDRRAVLIKEPYTHYLVTATFLCDADPQYKYNGELLGFWDIVPNISERAFDKPSDEPSRKLYPVKDPDGRPYAGMAPLKPDGTQMKPDENGYMPEPLVCAFQVYGYADFDELGLFNMEHW